MRAAQSPQGAPWFSGPGDPSLQKALGVCFGLLVFGCVLQLRCLAKRATPAALPGGVGG